VIASQRINARWLVDGKDTFKEMARAIRNAKESIFIADWFFSAEIYLIRENEITGSTSTRTMHSRRSVHADLTMGCDVAV
jgi:phosphatidylserine/phosphatidylglycerophosphate/cardiolipin synthase-like enzyme